RSATMARIRSTNTTPELAIRKLAFGEGLRFRIHDKRLPGCPDLVFVAARLVVFIDGDFWHGWRFPAWKRKLGPYWQAKIERNRRRDRLNHRRLRRGGWTVLRFWEHDVEIAPSVCVARIVAALNQARKTIA